MKIINLTFLILIILSGCSSKKKNSKKDLNDTAVFELVKKYNALKLKKDLNNYSYTFYEKLIKEKKLLAFKGPIADVAMNDSLYIVNATAEINNHLYIAQMTIDIKYSDKLKQALKYDTHKNQQGVFILKVSNLSSKNPAIDIQGDSDGDPYITFGDLNTRVLIFKAELIDFYIFQ